MWGGGISTPFLVQAALEKSSGMATGGLKGYPRFAGKQPERIGTRERSLPLPPRKVRFSFQLNFSTVFRQTKDF